MGAFCVLHVSARIFKIDFWTKRGVRDATSVIAAVVIERPCHLCCGHCRSFLILSSCLVSAPPAVDSATRLQHMLIWLIMRRRRARTITGQGPLLGSGGQPELHCSACLHFVRFTTRFSLCAACYIRSVPLCELSLWSEKKKVLVNIWNSFWICQKPLLCVDTNNDDNLTVPHCTHLKKILLFIVISS